jgi:hypothetical protein
MVVMTSKPGNSPPQLSARTAEFSRQRHHTTNSPEEELFCVIFGHTTALEQDLILVAKRGTCKIHLRLVAQAFQPVQMRVAGRCNINDPQFSKMLFMKEYQDDILQI